MPSHTRRTRIHGKRHIRLTFNFASAFTLGQKSFVDPGRSDPRRVLTKRPCILHEREEVEPFLFPGGSCSRGPRCGPAAWTPPAGANAPVLRDEARRAGTPCCRRGRRSRDRRRPPSRGRRVARSTPCHPEAALIRFSCFLLEGSRTRQFACVMHAFPALA